MMSLGLLGIALALAGGSTPFIILWLRHRALANRTPANRQPTEAECRAVRKRGRVSVIAFVLFWVVSFALAFVTSRLDASATVELAVLALILLMALLSIIFLLSTRCPICEYRLGYQRSLEVPTPACGADL